MEITEHPDFEGDYPEGQTSGRKGYSLAQAISLSREVEDLMLFVDGKAPVNTKVERLCHMYRRVAAAPDFPAGPGFDDRNALLSRISQMVRRLEGIC